MWQVESQDGFPQIAEHDQDKNGIGFIFQGEEEQRNTIVDKWQMPIGAIFFPNQIPLLASVAKSLPPPFSKDFSIWYI